MEYVSILLLAANKIKFKTTLSKAAYKKGLRKVTQTKQINEKLIDEAEAWIVRLRSDHVTHDDKVQFSSWLNSSQDHSAAFDYAAQIWETLGFVANLPELCEEDIKAHETQDSEQASSQHPAPSPTNVANLNEARLKKQTEEATKQQKTKKRPRISWKQGFALAGCYALIAIAFNFFTPNSNHSTSTYETAAGEFLSVDLEDGSVLELNTKTRVEVSFTKEFRQLKLLRGEAYFSVEPDKSRPFVVDVGDGSVTAVGTAFNIRRDNSMTSVTVTEGIVDVELRQDEHNAYIKEKRRVTVNQQVKLGNRGLSPIKNVVTDRSTAWRDKTLVFNDTDMPDALLELNRYLDTPAVADESLDDLRISGTFSLSHPDDTLDAIVTSFNLVKVKSSTANYLYLSN
ncbi:hypothetical protein TDB9533_03643 [Thalassocella blandensis]|nr:hypothetical protein TDB9533_03643 [Thalassocella blandensis]